MPPLLAAASLFAVSPAVAETRPIDATIELSCSEPFNDGIKGLSIRVTGQVPTETRQGENVGIADAAVELLLGPAGSGDGPDELAVATFGFSPNLQGARAYPAPPVVAVDRATATRVPGATPSRWRATLPWNAPLGPQALGQTTGTDDVVIGAPSFILTAYTDPAQAGNLGEDYNRAQRCVPVPGQQPLATIENVSPEPPTRPVDTVVALQCTGPFNDDVVGRSLRIRGRVPQQTSAGQSVALEDATVQLTVGGTTPGAIAASRQINIYASSLGLGFDGGTPTTGTLPVGGAIVPRATNPDVPEWTGSITRTNATSAAPATVTQGSSDVAIRVGTLSFGAITTSLGEIELAVLPPEQTCVPAPGQSTIATVENTAPDADTQAPSVPQDLRVVRSPDGTSAQLTWSPSTDDAGVTAYEIVSAGRPTVTTTEPKATVTGLSSAPYTVSVRARDAAGNVSAPSEPVTSYGFIVDYDLYDFDFSGNATMKTLTKGAIPLRGRANWSVDLRSGRASADLSFQPTQARLTALGFIPVTAKVTFVTSGKTEGILTDGTSDGNGVTLATKTLARIKLPEVKLFGTIPLAGGTTCQTKALSTIALRSVGDFDLFGDGGTIAGTFAISNLSGCGALNGLVSPLTAGTGNTMKLALTRR